MSQPSHIPNPSLSLPSTSSEKTPRLAHTLRQEQSSVLSLAADDLHIFSGSQGQDIYVWDRCTFEVKTTLKGHTGSVLALEVDREKEWLFSSSGDSTVRIWSTVTLRPLFVIVPFEDTDAGDIFSLAYSPSLQTLYFGCQNTSLQWLNLSQPQQHCLSCKDNLNTRKRHKFFDSRSRSDKDEANIRAPMHLYEESLASSSTSEVDSVGYDGVKLENPGPATIQIPAQNSIPSAHYGYIYCMTLPAPRDPVSAVTPGMSDAFQLVTGSGDESVKLWGLSQSGIPELQHTFEGGSGGVLSLIIHNGTIFGGCQDGHVQVWDIETRTLVRTIIAQEGVDVLSLTWVESNLYTCCANGSVQQWSSSFNLSSSWPAHSGIVISSIVVSRVSPACAGEAGTRKTDKKEYALITGASDNNIKLWDIETPNEDRHVQRFTLRGNASNRLKLDMDLDAPQDLNLALQSTEPSTDTATGSSDDTLTYALSKFVSIPSVSNDEARREDCRQAAIWLKKCLKQLGAQAELLPTERTNPIVLGTFGGSEGKHPKPRVLFYGHYDVISASASDWSTDPFTLTGQNGYLYGRGVSDNKGPILAVACAASELLERRELEVDLVVLIEGEEESGSGGFVECVRKHKDKIGHIDAILISNSYWIGEDTPCITYGLRGVVHSTIEISSERPDLHSGVDGGAVTEPMIDLVKVLSTLSDGSRIQIPAFYDDVRSQDDAEKKLYDLLSEVTQKPASLLAAKWSEPSLSIHSVGVSGPGNATVIPARANAKVSVRIVPDQDLDTIARSLEEYIKASFRALQSSNTLQVSIDHTANWWLGELDNSKWFTALEDAVKKEWGVQPLRIREGGSIPSIPFLEKEFGCHALQLPMGQSSDQAHLRNERISLKNLRKGKLVVERFFRSISQPAFVSSN